ncbi:hypothetical protein [Sphingomonas sp.]|nr:hypothetical protein [Sphingomonas sp.]
MTTPYIMTIVMTIIATIFVACAALSWMALRRCPLARAVGLQISQISAD